MNPLLVQFVLLGAGAGIGYLVKHLQGAPTSPVVPATDPYVGLPGLKGHPLLNSPIVQTFLSELENQLMASVKAQVPNLLATPVVAAK